MAVTIGRLSVFADKRHRYDNMQISVSADREKNPYRSTTKIGAADLLVPDLIYNFLWNVYARARGWIILLPAHHSRSAHSSGTDHCGEELIRVEEDDAEGHCDEELASNDHGSNEPLVTFGNEYDAQERESCGKESIKVYRLENWTSHKQYYLPCRPNSEATESHLLK